MSGPSPLEQARGSLNWDAASVELPPMPVIPPGVDAMSMTIAGVIPTLTAPLTASVEALRAKETTFSGKLVAAESAYQTADDSGGQSVGQLTQMLGQVGQMAQQGGGGGGMGSFGQIMQQAMQAAQGALGSQGGSPSGGGSQGDGPAAAGGGQPFAVQGPSGGGAAPQQTPDDAAEKDRDREHERVPLDTAEKDRDREHERVPLDAAEPGRSRAGEAPMPVAPPAHPHHDDDIGRRL